jgi:hypothetical protein
MIAGLSTPRRRRASRGTWPALGGVRTTLPHGLLPRRRGVFAAFTLNGRRAFLRRSSAAMVVVVLGAVRPVPLGRALRGRRHTGGSRPRCSVRFALATAEAAQAEEREWAVAPARSFMGTLVVVRTDSARFLHLATATLADPFVSDESSSPHAEPAMDSRCLATTPPAVVLRIPVNLKHRFKCAGSGFRCKRIDNWVSLRQVSILNVECRLGDARMTLT